MLYNLRFFCSKCTLFHNANLFGSCVIHILYTGCAKIKKINSGAKRLTNLMHKICFTKSLFHAYTCYEHSVLIVRRSKLYYTASGIITPIGGRPVHRLREDSDLRELPSFPPPHPFNYNRTVGNLTIKNSPDFCGVQN